MNMASSPSAAASSPLGWKLWATGVAVLFSAYKLFTSPVLGDSIFGFIIAGLLFFSEAKFVPSNVINYTRYIFKYGDKYARFLLFLIAIGGTALAVKKTFGLSLLPDSIDFWIKRSGPPLVIITITIYTSFILSKITFHTSEISQDLSIKRFEFMFYTSVLIFCFSIFFLMMGVNFIENLVSNQPSRPPSSFVWSDTNYNVIFCLSLVSLVWSICYGLCVFSRFCEFYLRDSYADYITTIRKDDNQVSIKKSNNQNTPDFAELIVDPPRENLDNDKK